ncbi:hypothetical protein [Halalkalibacterium ligniniphilum]|uniref:hypothetical protein n=1 Tax=Halalkalibacterium ligniniphilum TaxID=1134413 RepID=UPI00034A6CC2|nr:hypothetical protein [Halalkalibacterium ligniniphilum]
MPYITAEYYKYEYMGVEVSENDLTRFIQRASDVIDQVTNYAIDDFENLHPFVQGQVMKATAAQVEFYQLNGGTDISVTGDDATGVAIGKFSYGGGNRPAGNANTTIAANLVDYLLPTGLLYSGIGVVDSAY